MSVSWAARSRRFGMTESSLEHAAIAADQEMGKGKDVSVMVVCRSRSEAGIRARLDGLGAKAVGVVGVRCDR